MDRIIDTVDSGVAPLEIEGWYSTEDLYQRLVAKGIDLTYSAFYGRLQRLSKRGAIEKEKFGKFAYWREVQR